MNRPRNNIYREEYLEDPARRGGEAPRRQPGRESFREIVPPRQLPGTPRKERIQEIITGEARRPRAALERINVRRPRVVKQSYIKKRFFGSYRDIRGVFMAMEVLRPPVSLRPGSPERID